MDLHTLANTINDLSDNVPHTATSEARSALLEACTRLIRAMESPVEALFRIMMAVSRVSNLV